MTEEFNQFPVSAGQFRSCPGLAMKPKSGRSPDPREDKGLQAKPREIYVADMHNDALKLKARNFP